jgi:hypothetical protein
MSRQNADILAIRSVLGEMDPKASATAAQPLLIDEIYTPASHALALDPSRPLVVGNRGVGKSVWSGVLADDNTRRVIAQSYPNLGLDRMVVELGFHEGAAQTEGVAPSPRLLPSLLAKYGIGNAEAIWNAVLLRAVAQKIKFEVPSTLDETISWMLKHIEEAESVLRNADNYFIQDKLKFVLVFDALDRLAASWADIRPLTEGVLRLSLSMLNYRAMRAKIFMRTDQAKDEELFWFPDASKIHAARVELAWHATELYGLLFKKLHRNEVSAQAFDRIVRKTLSRRGDFDEIDEPAEQKKVFSQLAGEFMGADRRRGSTYIWVIRHLADAFDETTPRSFLITLRRAATAKAKPTATAIDHLGIREGVQAASEVRVSQLGEDYPWIRRVLQDLEGLEVPCNPSAFTERWQARKTVDSIRYVTDMAGRPGPIELQRPTSEREGALLEAVKNIGVVEERSLDRINMPDIFRVAARIKRRGGVRPPVSRLRRAQ